jgi:cell division protein FtsN
MPKTQVFELMNRLIEHIERLLLLHDCVIIPDFGGFVLRSVSASYNAEANMFFPPRKEVVFNRTLDHNDGLLMESYMKKYNTDFNRAHQLVGSDTTLLKDTLENEGELLFGKVGFFVKDEERLVFMAEKNSDLLFSTSSFGLPIFHFLPLKSRKQSAPVLLTAAVQPVEEGSEMSENKNILYKIPVTKTFMRVAAAVAAAILLFLLISTPVKDVNKESYKASFVPQEIMPAKTIEDVINKAFENMENQEPAIINQEIESREQEAKVNDVLPAENIAKTETPPPAETPPPTTTPVTTSEKKNFYVIIGSFDTKTQANKYIKNLNSQESKTAGIITVNGHVRVYAQGFVTEKSANSYMNKLRQTTKHKQAWIYKNE